jgi:hypothetical protein
MLSRMTPLLARVCPRLQLVELTDQRWFPQGFRDLSTGYLATMMRLARPFDALAPRIAALLGKAPTPRVIDLCSGVGGPWSDLAPEIGAPVVLTDLYPHEGPALHSLITREKRPVDARRLPAELDGVRTLFDGFHHFAPEDARAVLRDAYEKKIPIVIAEGVQRSGACVLQMLLSPLFVLLVSPLVRPFSFKRLFLTYLVPLVPLFVLFDGLVSCLRAYTERELHDLAKGLDEGYGWEFVAFSKGPARVTAFIGTPR